MYYLLKIENLVFPLSELEAGLEAYGLEAGPGSLLTLTSVFL
jgi:hypothetical protein